MKDKATANQIIAALPDDVTMEDICKHLEIHVKKDPEDEQGLWINEPGRKLFIVAGLIAAACFFELLCGPRSYKTFDMTIYGAWLIIPPIWFLYEYSRQFPVDRKLDPVHFADFKFTQELSSKFWAALLVLFGIMLIHKHSIKLC